MNWHYSGDVNPEYGGIWINLDNWEYGYAEAVKVTDLDSGAGFTGAVEVEHIVIHGMDDRERTKSALRYYGIENFRGFTKEMSRLAIAEALASYGDYEQDRDGGSPFQEVLQLEPDGPMVYDGWKADKRLRDPDLKAYVESVHLD